MKNYLKHIAFVVSCAALMGAVCAGCYDGKVDKDAQKEANEELNDAKKAPETAPQAVKDSTDDDAEFYTKRGPMRFN